MTSINNLTPNKRDEASINKRLVLLIITITNFFFGYMLSAVNIALPAIDREFHSDAILLGWVTTAAILSAGVLLLPFGRISDIAGIKKIFALGMILYTLAAIIAPFSTSVMMLIAIRALQGVSAAMVVGNATALISAIFPPGERGRALGISVAAVYLGVAASPLIGGTLTDHFGWRSTFIVIIPAGIAITALVLWKIKGEWRGAKGERLDYTGSLIFAIAIISLMYGLTILPSPYGAVFIGAGIICMVVFLIWESRTKDPILNISIFKNNRIFVFSSASTFINYAASFSVVFLLSLYLQYIKGFSAETAGLIMISQPVMQACFSPLAGRLSDKIESQIVASTGMAVCCLALVMLIFLNADTSIIYIIAALLILGVGLAMFVSPNNNAGMSSVEPKVYGVASAIIGTMRQAGQLFSMGITMVVLAVVMGRVNITPEFYPGFVSSCHIAFIFFGILSFVGIFLSLARGKLYEAARSK